MMIFTVSQGPAGWTVEAAGSKIVCRDITGVPDAMDFIRKSQDFPEDKKAEVKVSAITIAKAAVEAHKRRSKTIRKVKVKKNPKLSRSKIVEAFMKKNPNRYFRVAEVAKATGVKDAGVILWRLWHAGKLISDEQGVYGAA